MDMVVRLKRLFILFFLFILFQTAYADNLTPFTVILDWLPNANHAPLYIAKEQGYFTALGLDVTFITPSDSSAPAKLVAAGKADVALTYQPSFVLEKKQHVPLVQIGTLIGMPLTCLVTLNNNIHSLKDLKGKTIGYSDEIADKPFLTVMLANAGLTLDDVTLLNVHFQLTQALMNHKIDAAIGMMRNIEVLQLRHEGLHPHVFYPEELGIPIYSELIIVANSRHMGEEKYQAFLSALTLGVNYLINHPEKSWKQFIKENPSLNTPLNHTIFMSTLPRFTLRPGTVDQNRMQTLSRIYST